MSGEFVHSRLKSSTCTKTSTSEQIHIRDANSPILIDSDHDEEMTSSETSEDFEEEEMNYEKENLLQSIHHRFDHRTNLCAQTINIACSQSIEIHETTRMTHDQLLAHTMAVLAAKFPHTKLVHSTPTEQEIQSFVGPCPLYSLASSFGLDMHHGLSYFPCRDVLVDGGGGGPFPASLLWIHLTAYHNLNLSSSSLIISHLLLHGYSSPNPILFSSTERENLLRTTPRFSLVRKCPLTTYGVYGIQYEHGARLCSGFTYNTNIYIHLISFHNMTDAAALRLSRAIAFYDRQFKFQSKEIIVSERVQYPLVKKCQIKKRIRSYPTNKFRRILPVTNNTHG